MGSALGGGFATNRQSPSSPWGGGQQSSGGSWQTGQDFGASNGDQNFGAYSAPQFGQNFGGYDIPGINDQQAFRTGQAQPIPPQSRGTPYGQSAPDWLGIRRDNFARQQADRQRTVAGWVSDLGADPAEAYRRYDDFANREQERRLQEWRIQYGTPDEARIRQQQAQFEEKRKADAASQRAARSLMFSPSKNNVQMSRQFGTMPWRGSY